MEASLGGFQWNQPLSIRSEPELAVRSGSRLTLTPAAQPQLLSSQGCRLACPKRPGLHPTERLKGKAGPSLCKRPALGGGAEWGEPSEFPECRLPYLAKRPLGQDPAIRATRGCFQSDWHASSSWLGTHGALDHPTTERGKPLLHGLLGRNQSLLIK